MVEKYLDVIKSSPLFKDIETNSILSITSEWYSKIESYDKDNFIFLEGETLKNIGIILLGSAQIITYDFYGNKNIIASLEKSQLFGEAFVCALKNTMPMNVLATENTKVLFINYKEMTKIKNTNSLIIDKIKNNMLKIISEKNILLNKKIDLLSKRSTKEKILAYLYSVSKNAKSKTFTINLNRQELADFLSIERTAMSSKLSSLQREGVIKYDKNNFEIL